MGNVRRAGKELEGSPLKVLTRTQFGNPILRQKAQRIPVAEIQSDKIQSLIADMRHTLLEKKLGIALAAPQVGESVALVVIAVRPLIHRHKVKLFDMTLINPEITECMGQPKTLWEGCISSGRGGKADLFGKVPRHPKIRVRYYDPEGAKHHEEFTDLKAHIIQHEVDHLKGILFVDRVKDTKTFITYHEYMKMVRKHLKSD
jgi:peptide deformylase